MKLLHQPLKVPEAKQEATETIAKPFENLSNTEIDEVVKNVPTIQEPNPNYNPTGSIPGREFIEVRDPEILPSVRTSEVSIGEEVFLEAIHQKGTVESKSQAGSITIRLADGSTYPYMFGSTLYRAKDIENFYKSGNK